MQTTNQKIGNLIYQIRQDRGLTQAEFAKQLKTSQSAVNRIEHGRQNLSLEMLARISDALNKQIINVSNDSVNLKIEGGHELSGSITLKRSKNATVALLCASLLNYGTTIIKSAPKIEEVFRIIEVLQSIGVKVSWINESDIEIKRPVKLELNKINEVSAKKTRSVLMLLGPLIHEFDKFSIPYSGGCKLGKRTVTPHLYALEEFGVDIKAKNKHYSVSVNKKLPQDKVVLYEASNTATNNALMAAAKSGDKVTIHGASADYMVQDLCQFLNQLGVKIKFLNGSNIEVSGINKINKRVIFAPTEDPIEAMFFVSASITTNSKLTIKRVPVDWIALELLKLKKMGLQFHKTERYKSDNGVTDLVDLTIEKHNGGLVALADKLHPNLWPGINPDNISYFVPICGVAKGRTLIHDWIFENRAIYFTEMAKIGMHLELADPHRIYITGPTRFTAGEVVSPPALRPASLLLIGMLAANGTSILRNIYTINRGYEDIAKRLNSIGAKITILNEI